MKHYLFDFDGTLVDSMPVYAQIMKGILDDHGVAYGDDIIKIITPLGLPDTAVYFQQTMGVPRTPQELLSHMHASMIDAYTHRVPAKKNVVSVLHELRSRGCHLHVLTASPHCTLDPCLKRLQVFDLFDNVWSCEDFGMNKANPEIYRLAAQRIGAAVEEILFLDDNPGADRAAKEAGMRVCAVHDAFTEEFTEEMKRDNDAYIDDFEQLLDLTLE